MRTSVSHRKITLHGKYKKDMKVHETLKLYHHIEFLSFSNSVLTSFPHFLCEPNLNVLDDESSWINSRLGF